VQLAMQFPGVASAPGHYESVYLTAHHPRDRLAVWIRYTVHKRPGAAPTGSIWFTLFTADGPSAVKVTSGDVRQRADELVAVGDYGAVRRDGALGAITGGIDATWNLRFEPEAEALEHLPFAWLYRAAVPRTKSTSPYPSMRVTGTVSVGDRVLELDGWRGMLGHNWGSEHAHRWVWLRGASFTKRPDAWLDVVIGRIKVGPLVLPWIANGVLALTGDEHPRHRIGGFGRRVSVTERRDGCDLVLPGNDVSLTVHVDAPLELSVGWEYADPAGGRHQVRNCSVAGMTVQVRRRGSPAGDSDELLSTEYGGVYELGTAEFDPALPLQPYPDG
jgi:hypothetical protein